MGFHISFHLWPDAAQLWGFYGRRQEIAGDHRDKVDEVLLPRSSQLGREEDPEDTTTVLSI